MTRALSAWLDCLLVSPPGNGWLVDASGWDPAAERHVNGRVAVGNGAFGLAGSLERPLLWSSPGAFIAGLFDLCDREPRIPALVAVPDWLRLGVIVDGEPVSAESGQTLACSHTLDLRRGVLLGEWRQRLRTGAVVQTRQLRLASLANRAVALQVAQIRVEQASIVTLEIAVTAGLELVGDTPGWLVWRTSSGPARLVLASAVELPPGSIPSNSPQRGSAWGWSTPPDEWRTFARVAVLARYDDATLHPVRQPQSDVHRARRRGVASMIASHVAAWEKRWTASHLELAGDETAQRALRFAIYHLTSAANPDDERVSIGARGLTGEGYLGHVFWDTETFMLPFYTLTWPEAARALLMYRYHTLPAARSKAERLGYRGALYAWESADTGDETTPLWGRGQDGQVVPILNGTQEQHISADIAHAVWQYWQTTRDVRFLLDAGAEILLETARFWASRAVLEDDGAYHIRGVIGPDEYHEAVDDNVFTNGMAAWNLRRGLSVAALLRQRWPTRWVELGTRLQLEQAELKLWRDVALRVATGFDPATGLFEQFAGFFGLEDVDLRAFTDSTAPLDVVLGGERTRQAQVVKQADVLMLLALLPEHFEPRVLDANFQYYEPRCAHGSSLSPAIHALLAARRGNMELATRYFGQGASIDLDDARGDAACGVHLGALGGLWQAAVFGFGGLRVDDQGVHLDPHLPPSWQRLVFRIRWRGRSLRFEARRQPETVSAWLERGRPLQIDVRGDRRRLSCRGVRVVFGQPGD